MPTTRPGRWAGILATVFFVLLVDVVYSLNFGGVEPGTTAARNSGSLMVLSGIAAGAVGAGSWIKLKDRSIVVILAMVAGVLAILILAMNMTSA